MQLASVLYNSRPAIVAVRDGQHVLVRENAELGVDSSFSELVTEARSCDVVVGDEDLSWRSVVPNPCRIICLGLNYRAHVEETSRDLPTYPGLFTKWASSLTAAGAPVALPPESNQVDYEGELAVIIGREGRRIAPADALDHVAGLSVANDITMRDYQHRTHQWLQGKAWDASTPLGPYLVTLEEVSDIGHLDLRLELNGQEMQSSNTELLIFDVPTTIARLSEFTTLQPGDVILTGTRAAWGRGVTHRFSSRQATSCGSRSLKSESSRTPSRPRGQRRPPQTGEAKLLADRRVSPFDVDDWRLVQTRAGGPVPSGPPAVSGKRGRSSPTSS